MSRMVAGLPVIAVLTGCHLVFPFGVTAPDAAGADLLADASSADVMLADAAPAPDAPAADTAPTPDLAPGVDSALIDVQTPPTPVTITNALSGPTGSKGSGVAISSMFWLGWRFQVPPGKTLSVSKVGVHATASTSTLLSIFGSLVALSGPNDYPDKLDLTGPDVIATTLFNLPPLSSGSQNVTGKVTATLTAGWYAVVFGSGKAGSTGSGFAPDVNTKMMGVQDVFVITLSAPSVKSDKMVPRLFVEGTMY